MFDKILRIPPFNVRIRSGFDSVANHIERFYSAYDAFPVASFADFNIRIERGRGPRRFVRPQARFILDLEDVFLPLPANQAAPLFEWGLNWAIATRPLGYLVMHAAVLSDAAGRAVLLPGFPGAGKSTLCASLAWLADWRLLSDELAILDPVHNALIPNPRPISLKNASIDIVRRFPGAELGPAYEDTRKGTVAHASIPRGCIALSEEYATARWVIFPKYQSDSTGTIETIGRSEAFALIAEQSFNRERMGESGFLGLCTLLDGCDCFAIEYGDTATALSLIDSICKTS